MLHDLLYNLLNNKSIAYHSLWTRCTTCRTTIQSRTTSCGLVVKLIEQQINRIQLVEQQIRLTERVSHIIQHSSDVCHQIYTHTHQYAVRHCQPANSTLLLIMHVSFRRHFKKIGGPHKHQIYRNVVENCSKPTTPSRSTGVRTHGRCHFLGNQMVEVTKPNRNQQ